MIILTEEEMRLIAGPRVDYFDHGVFGRAVEKAVLAKLAGMELPEPAFTLNWRDGAYKVTKPNIDSQDCYTTAQLHQAFAQGAASQLSAEPVAHINQNGVVHRSGYCWLAYDQIEPIFKRKEPK